MNANMNKNYYTNIDEESEFLYGYIAGHAEERKLSNALLALGLIKELKDDSSVTETKYHHCLLMCRMMIDLNMDLPADEEDILLASALCHIIPEEMPNLDLYKLLVDENDLDLDILDIITLLSRRQYVNDTNAKECFDEIKENKLALLIAITDRGNAVEQLHVMNSWQVRKYIYDTRTYYISMCIYAKEHYIELLSPLGILLEKLRNLTDVSEILLAKFESMEIALSQEILALQEDNATMRGVLKKLEEQREMNN